MTDSSPWDLVVVGGGSAGAVVAARASEDPTVRVLLLEAGTASRSADLPEALRYPHRQFAWLVSGLPEAHRWEGPLVARTKDADPTPYLRGRGLGGGSLINGGIALYPPPAEFDDWAAAGCTGWSASDVTPLLRALVTDLDDSGRPSGAARGPIPVGRTPRDAWGPADNLLAHAARQEGIEWVDDLHDGSGLGVGRTPTNLRDGKRVTTNDAYLEPVRDRPNLRIVGDALVDRVVVEAGRVTGVVVRREGEWGTVSARRVVLAAGAFGTPAILHRSGIGPREVLDELGVPVVADLPVGVGLQDHAGWELRVGLSQAGAPALEGPRGNVIVRTDSGHPSAGRGDLILSSLNPAAAGEPGLLLLKLGQCFARGWVRAVSVDPDVDPAAGENLLGDPRDVERARILVRLALRMLESARREGRVTSISGSDGIEPRGEWSDERLDDWIRANVRDTAHASSSCRMGPPDDPGAVVDPDGRVRGVDGLRIADASALPTVPRANTHLATLLVAERVAASIGAE